MKKAEWPKYLTGELNIKELPLKKRAERLYKIRQKAIEYIEKLIQICDGMKNVTDKSGKQFNKIFTRERYVALQKAVMQANHEGQLYQGKLDHRKWADSLARDLVINDMDFDYDKLLRNRDYRIEKAEELGLIGEKRIEEQPVTMQVIHRYIPSLHTRRDDHADIDC